MIKMTDLDMYALFELTGQRDPPSFDINSRVLKDSIDNYMGLIFEEKNIDDVKLIKDNLTTQLLGRKTISGGSWNKNKEDPKMYDFNLEFIDKTKSYITSDFNKFLQLIVVLRDDVEFKYFPDFKLFNPKMVNSKNNIKFKRKDLFKSIVEKNWDLYPATINYLLAVPSIFGKLDLLESLCELKRKYVKENSKSQEEVNELENNILSIMSTYYKPSKSTDSPAYSKYNISMLSHYFSVGVNMNVYNYIKKNILDLIGSDETIVFNIKKFLQTKAEKDKEAMLVLNAYNSYSSSSQEPDFELSDLYCVSFKFSKQKAISILSSVNLKIDYENINKLNKSLGEFIGYYFSSIHKIDTVIIGESKDKFFLDSKHDMFLFKEVLIEIQDVLPAYMKNNNIVYLEKTEKMALDFYEYMKKKKVHDDLIQLTENSDIKNAEKKKMKI